MKLFKSKKNKDEDEYFDDYEPRKSAWLPSFSIKKKPSSIEESLASKDSTKSQIEEKKIPQNNEAQQFLDDNDDTAVINETINASEFENSGYNVMHANQEEYVEKHNELSQDGEEEDDEEEKRDEDEETEEEKKKRRKQEKKEKKKKKKEKKKEKKKKKEEKKAALEQIQEAEVEEEEEEEDDVGTESIISNTSKISSTPSVLRSQHGKRNKGKGIGGNRECDILLEEPSPPVKKLTYSEMRKMHQIETTVAVNKVSIKDLDKVRAKKEVEILKQLENKKMAALAAEKKKVAEIKAKRAQAAALRLEKKEKDAHLRPKPYQPKTIKKKASPTPASSSHTSKPSHNPMMSSQRNTNHSKSRNYLHSRIERKPPLENNRLSHNRPAGLSRLSSRFKRRSVTRPEKISTNDEVEEEEEENEETLDGAIEQFEPVEEVADIQLVFQDTENEETIVEEGEEERRLDYGEPYTKAEFFLEYGNYDRWETAALYYVAVKEETVMEGTTFPSELGAELDVLDNDDHATEEEEKELTFSNKDDITGCLCLWGRSRHFLALQAASTNEKAPLILLEASGAPNQEWTFESSTRRLCAHHTRLEEEEESEVGSNAFELVVDFSDVDDEHEEGDVMLSLPRNIEGEVAVSHDQVSSVTQRWVYEDGYIVSQFDEEEDRWVLGLCCHEKWPFEGAKIALVRKDSKWALRFILRDANDPLPEPSTEGEEFYDESSISSDHSSSSSDSNENYSSSSSLSIEEEDDEMGTPPQIDQGSVNPVVGWFRRMVQRVTPLDESDSESSLSDSDSGSGSGAGYASDSSSESDEANLGYHNDEDDVDRALQYDIDLELEEFHEVVGTTGD